ncbi:family 1 extracellular solute-binding protein [Paenibacillus mucilaginosus 3016]|uniref:Family 1 extracellular solute-binding protein n=2 Tax=Paenibacillus mucilaginosus TaxID=61624 RepID=H6NDZ7_9BACL|nr:extracellular solute-binding protein [Paenibacillus mucilaginosus]AFC32950.1 family 1 extracellular solute-binding protein [Paenibacillus mucilaginosus 3016]AFH65261.1 ABC transporter substrate-binding protein [Paenibacillus mucilaginosus K02]WFA21398.1 extracellular solute-binding protein [Paenibacillus mucilaginosus]
MKQGFKKATALSLSAVLLAGLAAGCGGNTDTEQTPAAGGTDAGGKQVTLKIFQFKVEINEALNRLKDEYEKANPNVKLQIETVGGGADYGAALKTKFASSDAPDIFNVGGYREMDTWMEHLEDMSDQPWVKDVVPAAKEPMTKDGKLYGMPMNIEGYGLVYNKELFEKAGITETPKTLSQLEDAAKKLQAAGITPFSNGYGEWWILGIHNLNVAMARQADPNKFIAGLYDGSQKFGGPVFDDWTKLLDLTLKYGQANPLTTDYNTQVTNFASGKAAMMQQGNWTQVQIDKINPNLKLGVLPMPINEDAAANDKLFIGVPNNWVVNKNSAVKKEAKDFLNWLVTSDIGKQYMTKEFKFIPAFTNITADEKDLGSIATDLMKYSKEGKTLSWNWPKYPDGVTNELGATMQAYIAGKVNKDQMYTDFQKAWDNLKAKK